VRIKRMFGLAGAVESAAGAAWINENAAHTAGMSVEVRFIDLVAIKAGGRFVKEGGGERG
jgi:hypothetical protein